MKKRFLRFFLTIWKLNKLFLIYIMGLPVEVVGSWYKFHNTHKKTNFMIRHHYTWWHHQTNFCNFWNCFIIINIWWKNQICLISCWKVTQKMFWLNLVCKYPILTTTCRQYTITSKRHAQWSWNFHETSVIKLY